MPNLPNTDGHFGAYGGRYVSETLMPALAELERAYNRLRREPRFRRDLRELQQSSSVAPPWPERPYESAYNREAPVPPQCYTRTEARFNPCYVCHQTYAGRERPNVMNDGVLQGDYEFSDFGLQNRWSNLFVDRREAYADAN